MVTRGPSIFISYRRSNADGYARLLYEYLRGQFADDEIFFDRHAIQGGEKFPDSIRQAVIGCVAVIVVVAPDWLDVRDGTGRRRLARRNDWVRQELALALDLQKPIVPVLFEEATMPGRAELPSPLKAFADHQGHWLRGSTSEYEAQQRRLVHVLAQIPGVPAPRPDRSSGHIGIVLPGAHPQELPDRSRHLFGREGDLQALADRLRGKGLTAVVARPRMGKSWLLMELARRCAASADQVLVGVFDNPGASDPVLRAVQDLYARWLQTPDTNERPDVVARVTDALAGLFTRSEPVPGSLRLAPLRYEQVHGLIDTAARISGRRIVLFLDAWEKTQAPRSESDLLHGFLNRLDDWPQCHIVLALRTRGSSPDPREEEALDSIETLVQSRPAQASLYELREMDLAGAESERLLEFLRRQVRAAAAMDAQVLIDLIAGYPGVIDNWLAQARRSDAATSIQLVREAEAAHRSRYLDVPTLLEPLSADRLQLAIRLALLPMAGSEAGWGELRDVILQGIEEERLDDLKRSHVLFTTDPPGFGHVTRAACVLSWFLSEHRVRTRKETGVLMLGLAERLDKAANDTRTVADGMMALRDVSRTLQSDVLSRGLGEGAASMLTEEIDVILLMQGAKAATSDLAARGTPLLALGLMNAHGDAWKRSDRGRADEILAGLRALAANRTSEGIVQKRLAGALMNQALGIGRASHDPTDANYLPRETRYVLQDDVSNDLEQLAKQYPDEPDMRTYLAYGLEDGLELACSAVQLRLNPYRDAARRDQLLARIRLLASVHPEDRFVRTVVARGLLRVLNDAHSVFSPDPALRDSLVEELSTVAESGSDYPPELWENFAIGLEEMFEEALNSGDAGRASKLLTHLRRLTRSRPSPSTVRRLAVAVGEAGIKASAARAHAEAMGLFAQQRDLARELRHRDLEAAALANIAIELKRCGDPQALTTLREAAAIFAELADLVNRDEAATLLRQWESESPS